MLSLLLLFFSVNASADPIWIIEATDVLNAQEPVLVLDARESFIKFRDKNAAAVDWKDFSGKKTSAGELLDLKTLQTKLQKLGVRHDTPIAVFGDGADGWGADGRIVWMLRALGHERTYWVQGGLRALKEAGWPGSIEFSKKPGDFVPVVDPTLVATTEEVRDAIQNETALIDTREAREFDGKTPYGEKRGGHVPTSVPIHFKALFDKNGRVKSKSEIADRLVLESVTESTPAIAYCTGGVRSAMFVVVLRHYGFEAKNYAGSMWLWASLPAEDHPLMKTRTPSKKR